MLEKIKSPSELHNMTSDELGMLSDEIRDKILKTVSQNGGHLASNLGMVEATIALHHVFNSPKDKIVFDVGHQCYAHKLLTGRYNNFSTLRKSGGISGFTNKEESEHDAFYEGHSGTSLSQALGLAVSNKQRGIDSYVICVVGDGSFTNGLIFEALNNCSGKDINLIILLNDNEMSISQNIGGLHEYLTKIRTSKKYFKLKHKTEGFCKKIPLIGKPILKFAKFIKKAIRRIFFSKNLFENFGLNYIGPVDGHNIDKLSGVLEEAKTKKGCSIIHMITKKGHGYPPAEKEPCIYHSISPFDIEKGIAPGETIETFSSKFGEIMCSLAEKNDKICAITAAMSDGTGLSNFAKKYPDRFFDVGISEEHAVTFSSGLATNGFKPVCAIYSTFAQRAYDQLFHDISIQKLPFVLALDRCGIVEGDGITHQGIFDYSVFSSLPGVQIYSVEKYNELENRLNFAIEDDCLSIVRYQKGSEISYGEDVFVNEKPNITYTNGVEQADAVILTYGTITYQAYKAMKLLEGKHKIGIIKLIKIFPISISEILKLCQNAKLIYILEEGIRSGGVAEKTESLAYSSSCHAKIIINAIENFVHHGSKEEIYKLLGFDENSIADTIDKELNKL